MMSSSLCWDMESGEVTNEVHWKLVGNGPKTRLKAVLVWRTCLPLLGLIFSTMLRSDFALGHWAGHGIDKVIG
jgi:hypothetical protein